MMDNKKEEYTHEINRYTRNIIDGLIPKRIVPFDYYEERNIDKEIKNWIERSEGEFAVIVGEAGFGKTSLLCNLANLILNEEQYTVFFVKSENLRGKEFDKKILDDFEITETGLNAVLKIIRDENKKAVFLLDTLDVIATDEGIARLDDFLTKVKGENRIIIGASRPLEFEKIEGLTMKTFELKPFSDDEIRRLFDKYKAFYNMEGVELRLPVLEVCRNPLHMRMLFEVYQPSEIPEDINTQKLYDRYWEKKVGGIGVGRLPYLREDEKRLVIELKDELTKKIAVEMLKKKEIFLEEKYLKEEVFVSSYIEQQASISESENVYISQETHQSPATNLTLLMNNAYHNLLDEGVLREHEKTVEFFHQTFFEYAAARALIEEEEQSRQSLFEDLLLGITSLENWGILQQVILYAKRRENEEIAHKFLKELSETNFHTKILAIDILKHTENITEKDIEIYQSLAKDELEVRLYLAASLGGIISKHRELAIGMLETFSRDKDDCVRQATAHTLPKLVYVNPERATELIVTLSRDDSDLVQEAAVEALPTMVDVNPECAIELIVAFSACSKKHGRLVRTTVKQAFLKLVDLNPECATGLIMTFKNINMDVRAAAVQALLALVDVNPERAKKLILALSRGTGFRVIAVQALLALVDVNPERATGVIKTLSKDNSRAVRKIAAGALLAFAELYPQKAYSLVEKLKDVEYIEIQKAIAMIV
jgi:energy-coupling factor transporter ATP-binding protein EcfA2